MTKPSDDKKKLTVKKATIKDLKVTPGKDKDIKGGGGRLSQPRTPCDPGCTPC